MTGAIGGTDWIAILAGLGAIAWVNWYFFVAGRTPALAAVAAGTGTGPEMQEQTIVVDGGYSPSVVKVKAGRPVRLIFDRKDSGGCSEEVVFPDFGVKRFLPTGEKTVVEITPEKAGRYEFTCGMSMLRGALVAEEDEHAW
jgi:plastocyanin domain-containing protein